MFKSNLQLVINKTRKELLLEKRNKLLVASIILFSLLSIGVSFFNYSGTYHQVTEYRKETRKNWENRPDKHPHRMAHYGYLVFRSSHPLQIFDSGLDHYFGNMIFLEAHKQNTANLSEAGSSGVLVRFGTFSSAFILQAIVPLILVFLGFGLVAREREHATLKLLAVQGLSSRTILWGKIGGLWQFSMVILLPVILLAYVAAISLNSVDWSDVTSRMVGLIIQYMVFYFFVSALTVVISARSKTSSSALISLIGCWLLLTLVIPKGAQFLAQNMFPTPSRIALETAVEKDVLKVGDSHNPDDPHFRHIKDSLLKHYKVESPDRLPINYGGVVMKEGEKISSKIYSDHLKKLQDQYNNQQKLSELFGFINPMMSIKNVSMATSGTDYYSYTKFREEAEKYRYQLAQHMNDLQIEHISNIKSAKPEVISRKHWKNFPAFKYHASSFKMSLWNQWVSIVGLIFWLAVSALMIEWSAKKLKFV